MLGVENDYEDSNLRLPGAVSREKMDVGKNDCFKFMEVVLAGFIFLSPPVGTLESHDEHSTP